MLPIRTILHPTDFSERSLHAFRLACALARDYQARLVVVHVGSPPVIVYGGGVVPPEPQRYEEELREKLHQLQADDPKVRVEHRLTIGGDPSAEILRVAQEVQSDVIIMGTHGWTGLGRLLMGSVAEQVVRKAPCPVLTLRLPFPQAAIAQEHMPAVASRSLEVSTT
jgi:nucleotide-binding universal stress UspA family protein